jgi:hypothetical protein
VAIAIVALSASAHAAKMDAPADIAFDARIKHLEGELRCLVCQNQTLADSNAELADDLRREVRSLALSGKSDDEIKAYLVQRYGDFVLVPSAGQAEHVGALGRPVRAARRRRAPVVGGAATSTAPPRGHAARAWRSGRCEASARRLTGRMRGSCLRLA